MFKKRKETDKDLIPVEKPNRLELRSDDEVWGEIERYEDAGSDNLRELALNPNLLGRLSPLVQEAAKLAEVAGKSTNSNLYVLKLAPDAARGLRDGSLSFMRAKTSQTAIRGVLVDQQNLIRHQAILKPVEGLAAVNPLLAVVELVNFVGGQYYLTSINRELESLNRNIEEIKAILDAKELGSIKGNLSYLTKVQNVLSSQGLDQANLPIYRQQLELIERESLQTCAALFERLEGTIKAGASIKLEKSFLVFRDENKIKELDERLEDFKRLVDTYQMALGVRYLAVQVGCALPGNNSGSARAILKEIGEDLAEWRDKQHRFFDMVEQAIPQMDGLLADDKTPKKFAKAVRKGKHQADDRYKRLSSIVEATLGNIAVLEEQPLQIVIEVNGAGNIEKASYVNPPQLQPPAAFLKDEPDQDFVETLRETVSPETKPLEGVKENVETLFGEVGNGWNNTIGSLFKDENKKNK